MDRPERKVLWLPAAEIRPNPMQPRRTFEETGLRELAESIRRHGILQPLTVRRTAAGWELVAGERRLRAAVLAGLETVPCLEAEVDGRASALLALVENLQRKDLHYLEEAEAIAAFLHQTGMTQEAVAAQLGMSPSALANKLRLLRLSPDCRRLLTENGLTERHARAVLRLPESRRTAALEKIARDKLSVREADRLVDAMLAAPKDTPGPCRSTVPMVGDVRLFVNTLQHAVDLMTQRGIPAVTSCEQADGFLEYTVRIPTATPAPLPVPNTLPACHEPEMPSGEGSSLGEEDELVRS